ncbi:hypothetical protein V5O48_018773 [Marasmius crinis-equi]|uniref:CCHC-type domain-containing protein n=1 Tax=Marasmius crinis-equi TaxID=585013 RepID=A0ABR3EK79_9AGAR
MSSTQNETAEARQARMEREFTDQQKKGGFPRVRKEAPKWSMKEPSKLPAFQRECEAIWKDTGTTSEKLKIEKTISWIEPATVDKLKGEIPELRGNISADKADWKKMMNKILKLFPETKEAVRGSKLALIDLAEKQRIDFGEVDKTRLYALTFAHAARKLLSENPPVITQAEACEIFLAGFRQQPQLEICKTMISSRVLEDGEDVDSEEEDEDGNLKAPPVKWDLSQLCKVANKMQKAYRDVLYRGGPFKGALRECDKLDDFEAEVDRVTEGRGASREPPSRTLYNPDEDRGRGPVTAIKREAENTEGTVAGLADSIVATLKTMNTKLGNLDKLDKLEDKLGKAMATAWSQAQGSRTNSYPPRPPTPGNQPRYGMGAGARDGSCNYCKEQGHFIADCSKRKMHIAWGWLNQTDRGGIYFKDGTAVPKSEDRNGVARNIIVDEYAKAKGWEKKDVPQTLYFAGDDIDDDGFGIAPSNVGTQTKFNTEHSVFYSQVEQRLDRLEERQDKADVDRGEVNSKLDLLLERTLPRSGN